MNFQNKKLQKMNPQRKRSWMEIFHKMRWQMNYFNKLMSQIKKIQKIKITNNLDIHLLQKRFQKMNWQKKEFYWMNSQINNQKNFCQTQKLQVIRLKIKKVKSIKPRKKKI